MRNFFAKLMIFFAGEALNVKFLWFLSFFDKNIWSSENLFVTLQVESQ
jgi:hypothetical protein